MEQTWRRHWLRWRIRSVISPARVVQSRCVTFTRQVDCRNSCCRVASGWGRGRFQRGLHVSADPCSRLGLALRRGRRRARTRAGVPGRLRGDVSHKCVRSLRRAGGPRLTCGRAGNMAAFTQVKAKREHLTPCEPWPVGCCLDELRGEPLHTTVDGDVVNGDAAIGQRNTAPDRWCEPTDAGWG